MGELLLRAQLSELAALPLPSPQADGRALNITLNSIGTELTRDDRRKLYANFGLLYPHGQVRPCLVGVWHAACLCVLGGMQAACMEAGASLLFA